MTYLPWERYVIIEWPLTLWVHTLLQLGYNLKKVPLWLDFVKTKFSLDVWCIRAVLYKDKTALAKDSSETALHSGVDHLKLKSMDSRIQIDIKQFWSPFQSWKFFDPPRIKINVFKPPLQNVLDFFNPFPYLQCYIFVIFP